MHEVLRGDREPPRAPLTSTAVVEPRRATPWWAMLAGIAVGVVTSLTAAVIAFPQGGGDVIAAGSAIAMLTIPGGASFLATSCFARAALQPRRWNGAWIVLLVTLFPIVVILSFFVEFQVGEWIPDKFQAVGPGFHLVREGLPILVGATVGALMGFGLAWVGRDGRDSGPSSS